MKVAKNNSKLLGTNLIKTIVLALPIVILTLIFIHKFVFNLSQVELAAPVYGEPQTMTVNIGLDGQISITKDLVDTEQLISKVKSFVAENPNNQVVLQIHQNSDRTNALEVFEQLQIAGVRNIVISKHN